MAPKRLHNYLKTIIINIYTKSHAIPRSESKHHLAHLSNHLLSDNELSDHPTHTQRKGELCIIYKRYVK